MKKKWHNQIAILNYISSTERFKLLYLLGIILAAYGSFVLGVGIPSIFDSVLCTFTFPIFNIFFFAFLFLNTLNTYDTFTKKFDFYMIRLESKKKYIREILKNVLLMNLYYILIFLFLYFTFLNIVQFGKFVITSHSHYSIHNAFYSFFYLGRYLIYALLFSSIITLLLEKIGTKITSCIVGVFLFFFLIFGTSGSIQHHFIYLPWPYFDIVIYDSFSLELCYSLLYAFILEFIFLIFYRNMYQRRKKK